MSRDYRYLQDEEKFKEYAFQALSSQFKTRSFFESFYTGLPRPEDKDNFLRVASFYLFLVKCGDWHVNIEGSDSVVSYLTNSYKLAALFSLIESLSDERFEDFYQWLKKRDAETSFPIDDQGSLDRLYDEYKEIYGSIRRCVKFFEGLSESSKGQLRKAVIVSGEPMDTIKKLAQFLYNLRSEFVHEGKLAVSLDESIVLSRKGEKAVRNELTMSHLMSAFEEGIVVHFREKI